MSFAFPSEARLGLGNSLITASNTSYGLYIQDDWQVNENLTLNLVTNETYSCARDFVIPDLNFYQLLPETGNVQVSIPAQTAGSTLFFTCSMGMYTGQIVFENQ